MGRPRRKNQDLPPGVREIAGRFYWQPTSAKEREARKVRGEPASVALGADKAEARRAWAELMGHVEKREAAAAGTVAELLDRYEIDVLPTKKSEKTRTEYARGLKVLRAAFGEMRFCKTDADAVAGRGLRALDLTIWLKAQQAPVAANRHLAVLSAVFGQARAWGVAFHNPVQGVRRNEETPRDRVVEPWEADVLETLAGPLLSLLIRFARVTGWRESDILGLQRQQCRADGVHLKQGKTGGRLVVEWSPELRAILKDAEALPGRSKGVFVFPTESGTALTQWGIQSAWRRLLGRAARECEAAGLPAIRDITFHDLRAKAITDADEQGQDATKFAGHSDPRVTKRHYLRKGARVRPIK